MLEDRRTLQLHYIADSEVDLDAADLLATAPYVDVLERTVRDCETPFTIGLYGSWGSGKSSIVSTVCGRLEAEHPGERGIATFVYDAWKYSGDSFYRAFLLAFCKRFGLDASAELEKFYQDQSTDVDQRIAPRKGIGWSLAFWSPMLLVLVALSGLVGDDVARALAFFGVTVTVVAQVFSGTFATYKVTVNRPHAFAPEQFAGVFNEAVDEVLGKNRKRCWFNKRSGEPHKRLLIVIDNIDRCDRDTARGLLLNVKNFLERPDVVFILPLDPEAVKRFLGLPEPEASEYLRKIFNASVTIKPFTPGELFDFTQALNVDHELGLPAEAVSLVCQEFATNPRRVIQFLNTLQNELALAVAQEDRGFIAVGAVSGNTAFLAKMLVLREEWPTFYEAICGDAGMLQRVGSAVAAGEYSAADYGTGVRKARDLPDLEQGLYLFLLRSQTITAGGLDPFVVNRDMFKGVPDALYELVISQSWDDIARGVADGSWTLRDVIDFALYVGDAEVAKRGLMLTTGFNVLGLLGAMLADETHGHEAAELLGGAAAHRVAAVCELDSIDEVLSKLQAPRLVALSRFLFDRGLTGLRDRIVAHLVSRYAQGAPDSATANGLLVQFARSMADDPQTLTSIAPSFAVLAVDAPVDAANLLRSLSGDQRTSVLRDLDGSRMVALVEDEMTLGDEPSALEALDAVLFILREADEERLSAQDDTDYVIACARRMNQAPDESSRAAWLPRVDGWLANVSDDEVLRGLSEAIDPLQVMYRLQDVGLQAESILALGINADVVMAAQGEMAAAEARLAEAAVSEAIPEPVADFAAQRLSAAIAEFAGHRWSFTDTVLSAAETLAVTNTAFGRACALLNDLVIVSGDQSPLGEAEIDRLAGVVCRRGATKRGRALAETGLRSQTLSTVIVNRALDSASPDAGLAFLIWTECATSRARLIALKIDTSTSVQVASSVNALAQVVGGDALAAELGPYAVSLQDEDPRSVLRVIRGIIRSNINANKVDLSRGLLEAALRSDRAVAIEIIDQAISDGLAEESRGEWRGLAKAIDAGSLGKRQEAVMKRARKVLGYRRARS